jgi:hypothetical protein
MEKEKTGSGSGDSYEEEAPLFSEIGGIGVGPGQGEEAFLAADEEDDGPLQTLGGVEGEEGDPFGSRVPGVHLFPQGGFGEESVEVVSGA